MLSFVTPWLFGVAVAAGLVVAGLHLLSIRTPPPLMLPTARFVPDGEARAVARQPKLNDVRLLLLRVLALLCAGAALAGVRWERVSASELHLVVADERLAADSAWRDSVTRSLAQDDVLVDVSVARGMEREVGASLVAAIARATRLTREWRSLDRVALTIVVPERSVSTAGYTAWRAQWPGRVSLVSRGAPIPPPDSGSASVFVDGAAGDDLVAAAFARTGTGTGTGTSTSTGATRRVVIGRGAGAPRDTADATGILVRWPVDGAPDGWERLRAPDTVGALVARGVVMVGPFVRTSRWRPTSGARTEVIAWWSDGAPAAVETTRGEGDGACERTVAVALPAGSDVLLADAARGLREALVAPCRSGSITTASWAAAQNGGAPSATVPASPVPADSLAPASAFRVGDRSASVSDPWWLTPVLLGAVCAMLLAEWWWREREVAP